MLIKNHYTKIILVKKSTYVWIDFSTDNSFMLQGLFGRKEEIAILEETLFPHRPSSAAHSCVCALVCTNGDKIYKRKLKYRIVKAN